MKRPNWEKARENNTNKVNNNIGTYHESFFRALDIMLTTAHDDYYGGSKYFHGYGDNGRSRYYVDQPDIEKEIEEKFIKPHGDRLRFLVGFTGIGKTTLIRNLFLIHDDNIFISKEGKLIAYYSVFNKTITSATEMRECTKSFLDRITVFLRKLFPDQVVGDNYSREFYESLTANNEDANSTLGTMPGKPFPNDIDKTAEKFCDEHPIDFYVTYISYLMECYNRTSEKPISELTMIFDDIESKSSSLIDFYMEDILSIYSNFQKHKQLSGERKYNIKSLIVVRNYTVRMLARQIEAYRAYLNESFFKSEVPPLKEVFSKRFDAYYNEDPIREEVTRDNWNEVKNELEKILRSTADFGNLILNANHLDIARSLTDFTNLLRNKQWFGKYETVSEGKFGTYKAEQYLPVRSRMLKALMYGESEIFVDDADIIFSNILRFHSEVQHDERIRLAHVYVLEYMARLHRTRTVAEYGVPIRENGQEIKSGSISGRRLKNDIARLFRYDSSFKKIVEDAISFLYARKYLLRSIYDEETPEEAEEHVVKRIYNEKYTLYLSKKGEALLSIIQDNSVVLEAFRDDIDTDLPNNTIPSSKLDQEKCFIYLIKYCKCLFDTERNYISMAINKPAYFKNFGGDFVIAKFIDGIYNSYINYYKEPDAAKENVRSELNRLIGEMEEYKTGLIERDSRINIALKRENYPALDM